MSKTIRIEDIGKNGDEVLCPVGPEDLVPLPPPYDNTVIEPKLVSAS